MLSASRLVCIGRRGVNAPASPRSISSICLAQRLTSGVDPAPEEEEGEVASGEGERCGAIARVSSLLASSASSRASSALSCATSRSISVVTLLLGLALLSLRRRANSVIHRSRALLSMTKNSHHSLELSSSGSISRIRSWEAAKCRR